MKRFRVKVVGLGLALVAGTAVAADGDWRAPGQPTAPVSAGAPGLLPPAMRAASPVPPHRASHAGASVPPHRASHAGSQVPEAAPIWLPAREPVAAPLIVRASGQPEPDSVVAPAAPPAEQVGPRGNNGTVPFPVIPVPEFLVPPEAPVAAPAARQPDPVPPPRPAVDPPPMPVPRAPDLLPPWTGDPLPQPRPIPVAPVPAPVAELQPAPPELMVPVGSMEVSKHGTFGSPPLRLSRDYPPLSDLIHHRAGDSASLANRVFVRGEYLLWWVPGFPTPVLATTNANPALNGYFGEPGTTTILGPGPLLDGTRSGFRLRAGAWLDDAHSCGIDAGFFFLGNRSGTEVRDSAQFPLITRPVFVPNLVPGTGLALGENGEAVAVPDILKGVLTAQSDSRLWGADVNLRKCLFTRCDTRAEWFVGYRHLNLRESLALTEDITVIGPGGDRVAVTDPIGTRVVVQDRFATRNAFHGGQIGAAYERRFGRWDFDARGSVALGATRQTLEIDGFQVRQQPGAAPMNFRGGLLAAGPNIGKFERDKFSVAPELTLNFGYWMTPHLRVFAGYNFLLWTNVIRPGDQIDRVVDLTFVPNSPMATFSGQSRPRPLFAQRDLVVNGVQFGLDWRW